MISSPGVLDRADMKLPNWFRLHPDRRAAGRISEPGMVAFFWSGGHPHPNRVRDIGSCGAFIETTGHWYTGTILTLTLQEGRHSMESSNKANTAATHPAPAGPSLSITCMVTRSTHDGIGVQFGADPVARRKLSDFVLACVRTRDTRKREQAAQEAWEQQQISAELERREREQRERERQEKERLESEQREREQRAAQNRTALGQTGMGFPNGPLRRIRRNRGPLRPNRGASGESLIEFVLLLPLLMLLVVNAVNWGAFIFSWITVTNAARTAAQYAILGGGSVGAPSPASGTNLSGLVTSDFASLVSGTTFSCPASAGKLCVVICDTENTTATPTHMELWPTATTNFGTTTDCGSAPADPIALNNYKLISVDVKYFYTPPIPLFKFPGTGINLSLSSQTIHRQVQMRHL